MKVKKLMTQAYITCGVEENLATAVRKMWENDCGMVPIVEGEKVLGVVTDRDVAVAVSSSGRTANEISAKEVLGTSLVTCRESDSVRKALKLMAKKKLRRLPVTDKKGNIRGVFSIADAIKASSSMKKLRKPVLKTVQAIAKPHPILLFEGE